ncbi:MAG TPA: polysaccharide biosynthesis/export family protein, partial [Flavobacterium sp.]|nr:polysaccharide biosynthesis/export family protein [Flavobacterium sp.]
MIKRFTIAFIWAFVFVSCASKEKIVYFQNLSGTSSSMPTQYEPRLKTDDLLMIIVSSRNPEAVKDFNLPAVAVMNPNSMNSINVNTPAQIQTYLIDSEGFIQFPIIGKIKLAGLTRREALDKLDNEIKKYVTDAIINMRIMNFEVSVMGEVARPGTFNIQTERITLPEAISMAGDLTIYGQRSNVLIIREIDGVKTYNYVDMTKGDFINSPFYYLT